MALTFATFTKDEQEAVEVIIDRALPLFRACNISYIRRAIEMDLSATHATCPLRLQDLASAPDPDFGHDVLGIYRYLDRKTGVLTNLFCPRFAAPQRT